MPAPKGHKPYPGCEKGGRSLIYTKEVIESYADKFREWLKNPEHIWIKDFALENDFDPDLLSEWAKKNEKFSGAYLKAKKIQEGRLVTGGLTSKYNANFTRFVLANVHRKDWSERTETKISGDAANPLTFLLVEVDGTSKDLVDDEE